MARPSRSSRRRDLYDRSRDRVAVQQIGRVFAEAARERREQQATPISVENLDRDGIAVAEQWTDSLRERAIKHGLLVPRQKRTEGDEP